MKVLVFFLLTIVVSQGFDDHIWKGFKEKFHKKYQSIKDELVHHITYLKNLRKIVEHNLKYSKGEVGWYLAENEFTDLTFEEFGNHLGLSNFTKDIPSGNVILLVGNSVGAPDAFDWREQGLKKDVKDQRSCGSCWAFATIGTVECRYFQLTRKNIDLSEQQLVDCAGKEYGNNGCNGGRFEGSYEYLKKYGSNYESKYPYEGRQGRCRYSAANNAPLNVTGYQVIIDDENKFKEEIYSRGCLGVAVHVNSNFQFYRGGVFEDKNCSMRRNHAVLLVGYGSENNKDYWILKNSWSSNWGELGYMKILRNHNQCGIAIEGYSPDISV